MQGHDAGQTQPGAQGEDLHALLDRAKSRFTAARDRDRRDDEEAQSDLLMRTGGENQWDPRAVRERKLHNRPIYTANRFPSMEAQIIGEIQANPPAISCSPADGDATPEAAEVFEGLIRSIERLSYSAQVYSSTGAAAARSGRGHMRIAPVYADDESRDVELRIREIKDVLSVKWGPAEEFDKSDATWCIVVSELDKKGFQESYPNATAAGWANARMAQQRVDGWHSGLSNKITVAEEWCVEKTPFNRYWVTHARATYGGVGGIEMIQPTGEEAVIDGDLNADTIDGMPAQQFLEALAQRGFDVVHTRVAYKKKICMYLWGGDSLIAGPVEWKGTRIPIFTVPGRQVHVDGQTIHEGIIRHARDAQRLHNFARSADLELVSQVPKSPTMIPDKAIEGYEDEWLLSTLRPVPFVRYKVQPGAPAPQERNGPGTNPGPASLAQAGVADMEDTTGIHAASMGKKSNETSGVAIAERDAQTDTGTFTFIFHLRLIVESIGRELVAAIPHYYSTRKQIMILGQDDAPAVIELSQVRLDLGKYHVIAKSGPAYATKREKAADLLMQLAKAAPPWAQPAIFMRIAKLIEMPDADEFIEEIRAIGAMVGALPPPQQQVGAAPGLPPGMPLPGPSVGVPQPPPPGGLPPNVIPMRPPPGAPPQGARPDPLAGVSMSVPPPRVPAARPVVGDARMGAAPPG
jgi:hypothetical protein